MKNIVFKYRLLHKQFGLKNALKRVFKSAFRPIITSNTDLILIIKQKKSNTSGLKDKNIEGLSFEMLKELKENNTIKEDIYFKFKNFLDNKCKGFVCLLNQEIAGYAFLQYSGTYRFGSKGVFQVPDMMVLLKNLLVFPEYRGYSIGKYLNQKRIASVPNDKYPLVFVKADNRFAIRNLKMFGFEEKLKVRIITWFGKWSFQKITLLGKPDTITDEIIKGLTFKNKITERTS